MDRGSQLDEEDEEDEDDEENEEEEEEEEKDEEEEKRKEEEETTDIKSNNPHLAGGEQIYIYIYRTIHNRGWEMSHFGNIGHHLTVAIIDHIPNGWVMFNGDIS